MTKRMVSVISGMGLASERRKLEEGPQSHQPLIGSLSSQYDMKQRH